MIKDPAQWSEALAQEVADRYDIGALTAEHWDVIRALREHYAKFGVALATRQICHNLGKHKYWVHDLFHSCLNAWRVAGLPNPGEEAKTYISDY